MTDAHTPRVLSDADAAADLAGLPRPSAQIAKIMALVRETVALTSYHGMGAAVVVSNIAAVEAALRDAPQQAEPPEIDYEALIAACYKRTKAAQGTKGCVQFAAGAEWYREQIAARPSAPTAKPLFGEMIAQHPGLREEIAAELVEQDERAAFEAAYRARYPVSCDLDPAKFNRSGEGDYEDIRVSIAWAMWQARASKGTP